MKQGKIFSLCLLSLLVLSIAPAFLLTNADLANFTAVEEPTIYQKPVFDRDGDKIDDKLMRELRSTSDSFVDLVVVFDHKVNTIDRHRLACLGVTSFETWDLNRRVLVTAPRNVIQDLVRLPGVCLITSAEKRAIMVAVEEDFAQLDVLEKYEGAKIFRNVGCALVPYYSGIQTDLAQLGTFSIISDVTDVRYETTSGKPIAEGALHPQTQQSAEVINATALWGLGYEGAGIKVAVLDSGINELHPDIVGRITATETFVKTEYLYDTEELTMDDFNGHGSHVAGIVAGDGTGDPQYIGVAPEAQLIIAKAANAEGSMTLVAFVAALNWAIGKGAEVVNLSYGGGDDVGTNIAETALKNAVRNKGAVCVISAGNEGQAESYYSVGTPGTTDDVICVGAIDSSSTPYNIPFFSSRALTADDHMKPDILAPGSEITSLDRTGSGYVIADGTSMAAPHVAGAVALLLHACKDNGISYNPGLFKAALMKAATLLPLSTGDLMMQGRGYINVGAAWDLISKAQTEGNTPIIGACNPIQQPLPFWEELLQGQVTEQYLTCVSPFKGANLSLSMSGDAAQFMSIGSLSNQWTGIAKITYQIPDEATLGTYTGQLTFKHHDQALDTVDVVLEVVEGNGHKMLLNFRTTDFSIDHMYGQFKYWTEDILANGFVLSELNTYLNETLLEEYDAIWFPDPFDYRFPNGVYGDYTEVTTWNPFTVEEKQALTNYVADGGSLFFCFLGLREDEVVYGTNITAINELTDQWGLHVRDTIWTGSRALAVNVVAEDAITAEVSKIDHFGPSLELSGDTVQLTEVNVGSPYPTLAYYQNENGGRVIILCTNFALDTEGYLNNYNPTTQNDVMAMNLFRWATSHHKIEKQSVTFSEDNTTVTMTYEYLNGPGADFGGFVKKPNGTVDLLTNWTEVSAGVWSTTYVCTEFGLHHFYPECGETGVDEFDYFSYFADIEIPTTPTSKTGGNGGIVPIVIILIGGIGLASWYRLGRRYRK